MESARDERILKTFFGGAKRYILFHGVLSWGISSAIIYRGLFSLYRDGFTLSALINGIFAIETLYALVIFAIGGGLWGILMWKFIKWEAKKILDRKTKKKK